MLQRAIDGTPAKRLLTSLVRASVSDSLLVLRAALSQAQSDLEATAQGPVGNYEGLGAEAKVRLLEMREAVHRSLIVKAEMLEKVGAFRSLVGNLGEEFSSEDYRDATDEWMGVTTEWIGLESGASSGGGPRKVRSNRFLADVAAIKRGEAKGDPVWQALQRAAQALLQYARKAQEEEDLDYPPRS